MIVQQFLACARVAEDLIASPGVATAWDEPSALDGYTVGGLAGHLARAVLTVSRYLDEPTPGSDVQSTDAAGYFVRVLGTHNPVDSDFHRRVRERSAQEAAQGSTELVARLHGIRTDLEDRLEATAPDRPVAVLEQTTLPLDEYLRTRLVELVVHLDDLAVSLGDPGPQDVPDDAYETVVEVLATVAARRSGHLATIRSLARRERQTEPVRAL